ncbi:hypothetical protein [Aestuariivirga sp.]|uniref:hypothetical protein n=1 Tax=Aestuariivirga sp. TaxID=2650926 RepID=UPI0039E640DD
MMKERLRAAGFGPARGFPGALAIRINAEAELYLFPEIRTRDGILTADPFIAMMSTSLRELLSNIPGTRISERFAQFFL